MTESRSPTFIAILAIAFAVVFFFALVPVSGVGITLREGDIASRTVRAPQDISFVSEALTKRRQDEAAAAVQPSITYNPSVATTQQSSLNNLLGRIRAVLEDGSLSPAAKSASLDRIENLSLTPNQKTFLLGRSPIEFEVIEREARRALASIYESSLPPSQVTETRERAESFVDLSLDRETAGLVAAAIRPFIITDQIEDESRTEAARQAARASVAPVQVEYTQNQIIVERDGTVTAEALEAMREVGIIDRSWQADTIGASALLAILLAGLLLAGWYLLRPQASARQLLALGMSVAVPVVALKAFIPFTLPDDDRTFLIYLLPLAATAMVLSGFAGLQLALLAVALMAIMSAATTVLLLDITVVNIASSLDLIRLLLVTGVGGMAGIFAVREAERLGHFLLGGFAVALSVIVVLGATWLIDPSRELSDWTWMISVGAANGALSAFLAAGAFVTVGTMFGVTTRLQLLEMSQLSQPLLLRLQDEAPSTFQHSVIVANLAEKGAHEISADALLARVGCYYHDIGKLVRPGFFIENQLGGANPHDALDPADSARIISDHVRDGINLAREYKLPDKVAAFVPEHHGTRVVAYFYRKAAEEDPKVDPDLFRYPGPKPQSRETAIAMLADSCEAAVRASADHAPERIDAIVDEVFTERLTEGQLDESELTLRNVKALNRSFKDTLKAIYHPRVEYPAPSEAELLLRRLPIRQISENN